MPRSNQWAFVSPVDDTGNAIGVPFLGNPASTLGPFVATTTSNNVPVPGLTLGGQVRILADADVRVAFGSSAAVVATVPTPGALSSGTYTAAVVGSTRVKAGVEVLSAPSGTTHIAFRTDSGTAVVEFTPGGGV